MSDHGLGNLLPVAIMAFFVFTTMWKRMAAGSKRAAAEAAVAQMPVVPRPPPQAPARRRLAPLAVVRPVVAQVFPASVRVPLTPSMAETLPAEAAAAFPGLDLSLPGTPGVPSPATRVRRFRTLGGGPAVGSAGWAANAVLALEILGPPVSLRSGATLGVPHAF
jgi:hypothetical protein